MNCIDGNLLLIDQILFLISSLDDSKVQAQLPAFAGATMGQHFRHIFDFYDCLFNNQSKPHIDYACRSRDSNLERYVDSMIQGFEQLKMECKNVNPENDIQVLTDFANNDEEQRVFVTSSLGRELMYAFDHAVHHLAIIKIGIRMHFPEIEVDSNLGKAPSTVKYEQASTIMR